MYYHCECLCFEIYFRTHANSIDNNIFVLKQVYQKHSHKVIPLPRLKGHDDTNNFGNKSEQLPITYSQLTNYVSQNNHKSLWKLAYQKYSASRQYTTTTTTVHGTNSTLDQTINLAQSQPQSKTTRNHENFSTSINLLPYDVVLREAIQRMYKCRLVQFR